MRLKSSRHTRFLNTMGCRPGPEVATPSVQSPWWQTWSSQRQHSIQRDMFPRISSLLYAEFASILGLFLSLAFICPHQPSQAIASYFFDPPVFLITKITSSPRNGKLAPGLGFVASILGKSGNFPLPPTSFRVISTSRLTSNLVTAEAMAYAMARLARKRPGHKVWPPPNGRYDLEDVSLGSWKNRPGVRAWGLAPQTDWSWCSCI